MFGRVCVVSIIISFQDLHVISHIDIKSSWFWFELRWAQIGVRKQKLWINKNRFTEFMIARKALLNLSTHSHTCTHALTDRTAFFPYISPSSPPFTHSYFLRIHSMLMPQTVLLNKKKNKHQQQQSCLNKFGFVLHIPSVCVCARDCDCVCVRFCFTYRHNVRVND